MENKTRKKNKIKKKHVSDMFVYPYPVHEPVHIHAEYQICLHPKHTPTMSKSMLCPLMIPVYEVFTNTINTMTGRRGGNRGGGVLKKCRKCFSILAAQQLRWNASRSSQFEHIPLKKCYTTCRRP